MFGKGKVDIRGSDYGQFLKKLAYDDDFRAALEADPQKVLAEHAVDLEPGHLPDRVQLPPKEELQKSFDSLLAQAESNDAQMVFGAFWRWR